MTNARALTAAKPRPQLQQQQRRRRKRRGYECEGGVDQIIRARVGNFGVKSIANFWVSVIITADNITYRRVTYCLPFPSPLGPQSDQTWPFDGPGRGTCERRLYRAAFSRWLIMMMSLYFGPNLLTSGNMQELHSKARRPKSGLYT